MIFVSFNSSVRFFKHSGFNIWIAIVIALISAQFAFAQDVGDYFRRNCYSCHTIGGGVLTGPDLKDVSSRQDRDWLVSFIIDPKGMINRGDPYAVKLKQDARDVVMPTLPGLSEELARRILDMIESESLLEESQFVGLQMSDEPFSEDDILQGRLLFAGIKKLENGGAACLSCHSVNGLGGLSGGRLGPDLTLVFERLQGRRSLAAWLLGPATETMQPLFSDKSIKQDEILALVAYLEHTAKTGGKEDSVALLYFFLIGIIGAVLILVLFDLFWSYRFRGVREQQVKTASLQVQQLKADDF